MPIRRGIEIGVFDQHDRLALAGVARRKGRVEIVDRRHVPRHQRVVASTMVQYNKNVLLSRYTIVQ